nr:ChaN family lipoprotein [Salinivibrio socompensis]
MTLNQVADRVEKADIILIGEWHSHPGVHRFQTELLNQLASRHPVVLSMEQFSRDAQPVVNQYLAGEIGEDTLKRRANAWDNYNGSYRPLVELAKQRQLDVIAANAPKRMVSCIGRQGLAYLDTLPDQQRQWFAATIDTQDSPYKRQFKANMHHGTPSQTDDQFAAQLAWDATMAESMVDYHARHPGSQIVHIAGRFHVAEGLGTAAQLKARNPDLTIALITAVSVQARLADDAKDFRLQVMPMPQRWQSMDEMREAVSQMKGQGAPQCH